MGHKGVTWMLVKDCTRLRGKMPRRDFFLGLFFCFCDVFSVVPAHVWCLLLFSLVLLAGFCFLLFAPCFLLPSFCWLLLA